MIRLAGAVEGRFWQDPAARNERLERPRSGWHAYRPAAGASMPAWAVEIALTIEHPVMPSGHPSSPRALLLARAAAPWQPLACALRAAMREFDSIAGTGPPIPRLNLVRSHPEPALDALPRRVVQAHLREAGHRGQAIGYRRRRALEADLVGWRPGAGAVLTCTGGAAVSAQAVVAVAGRGSLPSLRPPPGGATVLRAWRCHRARRPRGPLPAPDAEWALTTAVVLASPSGIGLGRVARRHAALIQVAGWNATVLTGTAALELARAGDPRYLPPTTTARHASHESVTDLLTACLEAAADETSDRALR
jgi:hypothetical protein